MKINKKFLDEITRRLDVVSASGRSTIEQIMLSAPQGFSFNELYEYVCEQYLPIAETCAENAAVVGASAYDVYREIETGEALGAVPYTNYNAEETTSAIRSFVGRACDLEDMSFLVDMLGRRLDAEVMRSYTDSQLHNGESDPRSPRFARVPSGPHPCDFCRALAGHGFFYHSRETAGDQGGGFNRFHDFCRCQVVPEFSDLAKRLEVAGYDPQVFVDEWRRSGKEFGTNRSSSNRNRMINPTKKTTAPKIDKPLLTEKPAPVKLPDKCFDGEWDQVDDMLTFLNVMFGDDECVGTCAEFYDKDGRRVPTRGLFQRTAGQIKKVLGRTNNVSSAVGRYRRRDGAFVRINPLDGKGVSDANVTAFRYALIECDNMPLEEQYAFIRALNLPTQCIVTSGGKSVHAVVKIDAKDIEEYRERVALLHAECKASGFDVDASTKNPSRFMRLPGIRRGKKRQALVSTGEGADSWDDWVAWCEEQRNK